MQRSKKISFKKIAIAVCALVLLFYGAKAFSWYFMGGRLWFFKSSCVKGHLAQTESCRGASTPGFMNSGSYYLIAKGEPRSEFCQSFIENYKQLDSEVGKACPSWTEVSCEKYSKLSQARCFSCDYDSGNSNTHYYLFAAVSQDCKQGVYFSGSKRKAEEFVDKIKF